MEFREISAAELTDNFFRRIGSDWLLVGAGTPEHCNAMTASWGQVGHVWNRYVATMYVRPQRYTREFTEQYERFSLSFFAPKSQRRALEVMGSMSGRDGDKIAAANLTVQGFGPQQTAAFAEATLVLVCRKLYRQDFTEDCFVDAAIVEDFYPEKDFHRMYIGEIEQVFLRD